MPTRRDKRGLLGHCDKEKSWKRLIAYFKVFADSTDGLKIIVRVQWFIGVIPSINRIAVDPNIIGDALIYACLVRKS